MATCVDAPHAIGTLPARMLDAPHATGHRPGVLDAPHAVGTIPARMLDAPSAIGTRMYPRAFYNSYVASPTLVDESGVLGGGGAGAPGSTIASRGASATVASEAAMLALTGLSVGEWVERTDEYLGTPERFYQLTSLPATNAANWTPYVVQWPFAGAASQPNPFLPDVSHTLASWVGDLSDYLVGVSLNDPANQMLSGTLTLQHFTGPFVTIPSPFHPEGGDTPLDAHNMTQDRTLTLSVMVEGLSKSFPTLLPGDPSIGPDGMVSLPVTDLTPLLMVEGQKRNHPTRGDDIIADDGDLVYAHDEMKEIGAAYGITIVCKGWPNYPIRELRMSDGNPLNWLDQIAAPFRAVRRWEGSTLIYEVSAQRRAFPLVDRLELDAASFSLNTSGMRTSWISNRLQPTPGQLVYQKRDGRDTLGFIGGEGGIQFQTGARYAIVLVKVQNGTATNGVFFDEAGNAIGTGIVYAGGTPAVAWRGNYEPNMPWGDAAQLPGYEVRVLGTAVGANQRAFPIDDVFNATLTSATLAALYGERPEYRSLDNPIVPTAAVNDAQLAAIQREMELSMVRSSWGTPKFNPLVRPRTTDLSITDFELIQAGTTWLVDGVSTVMSEPGDWYQTYSCLKARAA